MNNERNGGNWRRELKTPLFMVHFYDYDVFLLWVFLIIMFCKWWIFPYDDGYDGSFAALSWSRASPMGRKQMSGPWGASSIRCAASTLPSTATTCFIWPPRYATLTQHWLLSKVITLKEHWTLTQQWTLTSYWTLTEHYCGKMIWLNNMAVYDVFG